MELIHSLGSSSMLVIGESYYKGNSSSQPFLDEESATALRVGFQTYAPDGLKFPDFIEIRNPLNAELEAEDIEKILSLITTNGKMNYEKVICVGRSPLKALFNSLSKGRSIDEITSSPFLNPSEYDGLQVGVLPHFKSAFTKRAEDPLTDYWDKIKALFSDRPLYNCTDTEITSEEEFCQLLDFLDTLPDDVKIGLDYETNAVDPFNVDFQVTMYGLAYVVDKFNAKGFWYHPPKNEPLSPNTMDRWRAFLDKNYTRMWAYNVPFEIKATWDQVGKMYRMHDALVVMTVQAKRGSLKNVMRTELGASLWESSVHDFMAVTEAMFDYTRRSKHKQVIEDLFKQHDLDGLRKLHPNFDKWFNLLLEDYEVEDIYHAIDNYPYPWASVPPQVLGPYCAKDAGYALLLAENYLTDEFKLAYDFSINHPWLAAKFEVNGSPWDDGVADELKDDLDSQALNYLYEVISNMSALSAEDRMKATDIFYKELPYEVIEYTEKTRKEKRRMVTTFEDKIEELKSIFNPGSNTEESRAKFWDSYLTNDIILGTVMNIFIEDMEFNQSLKPLYDYLPDGFMSKPIQEILSVISEPDNFIKDNKALVNQCKRSLVKASQEYKENLGKFATDLIKNQYQVHSRWLGLKIDDRDTWSKEFTLLFNLFMFKKVTKTTSTNIKGKTGRSLVTEVVGKKWGKPLRGRYYEDKGDDESWKEVECVLNNSFNPLSADTMRWTSGAHTSPPSSPIRKILRPRSDKGLMVHCDFSQMELVCIAFMSGAKEMINGFFQGVDMHKFTASRAFNKPIDEVTSDERKAAKGVNFGIIYQMGVESLALSTTGGDVAKAQALMDMFFKAFPEIKIWIDDRFKEIDKNRNYVKGYFGNNLGIDPNQKGNAKYRNACLVGQTPVNLLDYTTKTIEDIYKDKDNLPYVYSFDQKTMKTTVSKLDDIWISKEVSETYLITLDNGKSFECTGDHLILARDNTYTRADELKPGNSLMPFNLSLNREGRQVVTNIDGKKEKVFHIVGNKYVAESKQGHCYHHLDHNKLNDNPDNLAQWDNYTHNSYHARHRNQNRELYPNYNTKQIESAREMVKRRVETSGNALGVSKEQYSALMKEHWVMYGDKRRDALKLVHNKPEVIQRHSEAVKLNHTKDTYREAVIVGNLRKLADRGLPFNTVDEYDFAMRCVLLDTSYRSYSWYLELGSKDWNNIIQDNDLSSPESSTVNTNKVNAYKLILNSKLPIKWKRGLFKTLGENPSILEYANNCNELSGLPKPIKSLTIDELNDILPKIVGVINHRVVSVEKLVHETKIPVYDFSISDTHNLALDCGIYAHNCNAPVQNMGSMVAGSSMEFFTDVCENLNMNTRPWCFTHDALDDVIEADDLIEYLELLVENMQSNIRRSFGMPVAIDYEIGANSLNLCGIKFEKVDDKRYSITLDGTKEATDEVLKVLNKASRYSINVVDVKLGKVKEIGYEELFTVGKALKYEWGKTIESVTITADLVYH